MGAPGPFQDKPSLRVEGLSLARGGRVLFEDLSFAVLPGGYAELRGANGAGKTSLLRALAGFLKPRAGRITFDIPEPALALHFVGHINGLKREASVRDHLRYWEGLFGARYADSIGMAAAEVVGLEAFGLRRLADLPVRALSQGQARRLALMRLHIAPRPIWLLDEPAAALDSESREWLVEFVESHRLRGGIAIAAVHEPLGPAPDHVVTL
jgi:heme exporter protein A